MKAAVLVGFGGVDQLELREVPEPQTGPGQVKVRVVATSINPIDWKLREGMKRPGMSLELPAILGRDASGEVVEVGSGVTRFRPGARVTGLVMGGYAERVVAKGTRTPSASPRCADPWGPPVCRAGRGRKGHRAGLGRWRNSLTTERLRPAARR
jgi:NADPH:quinone reductase-like Zn-dependent oxidoreductase